MLNKLPKYLVLKMGCDFIAAPMQELEFKKNQFNIFACVETLEHLGNKNIDACINLIAHSTKHLIVLTAPNKLFPLVVHDNKIPLSHWLPSNRRNLYTLLFNVKELSPNDFIGPWRLKVISKDFQPVSKVLTFSSFKNWRASYPFYSPYSYNVSNRWKQTPPLILSVLYYTLEKLLGVYSYLLSPNLCRIWIRR